jgi:hypothetical protein
MSSQEPEMRSLEELDADDQRELERVEGVVLAVVEQEHPSTIADLSARVRARAGEIDNSVIRAAILRLLNRNRLQAGSSQHVPVA